MQVADRIEGHASWCCGCKTIVLMNQSRSLKGPDESKTDRREYMDERERDLARPSLAGEDAVDLSSDSLSSSSPCTSEYVRNA